MYRLDLAKVCGTINIYNLRGRRMYGLRKIPMSICFWLLIGFFILELGLISLDLPNGDEGLYITASYMVSQGYLPHVDFWWPQSDGLLYIIAPFISMLGASLFSMKMMTSFFSLSIVIIIITTFLRTQKTKLISARALSFLFIVFSPFHFWFFLGAVGSKESIFAFFLVLSIYSCIRARDLTSIPITLLSSFLFSVVVFIKPTSLTLGLPLALYMLKRLPLKFVLTYIVAGICWGLVLNLPLILAGGIPSLISDLIEIKSHNEIRNIGILDGIVTLSVNLFILVISMIPTLILLCIFRYSFANRSPEGNLFYTCFFVGIVTNTVLFFPFSAYSYYLMYVPLLLSSLPYTLKHNNNNDLDFVFSKPLVCLTLVCFVSTLLIAVSINYKPEYLLSKDRRSIFYFGYNADNFAGISTQSIEDDRMLYLGRHQHSMLTLNPNLHPASVTSTSTMDLWKPSRFTANNNNIYATTNFVDLIGDVAVVVLETKTLDSHMNIDLPQLLEDLGKAGYVSHWSNEEHMIFEK